MILYQLNRVSAPNQVGHQYINNLYQQSSFPSLNGYTSPSLPES